MAVDDDNVFVPDYWDEQEFFMYADDRHGIMRGMDLDELNDTHLQDLFDAALFERRRDGETGYHLGDEYDALIDYLLDEYGIDFKRDFDWDSYRDWYDSQ